MLRGSTVLITGGTGSLGTALGERLLTYYPQSIRVLSNDENSIYELGQKIKDERLRLLIGDIRDKDRISMAMRGVDYVIHCAALKHVPLCEYNPIEAVKTNVLGSINIVECAVDCMVKKTIAISTDKAVHPINIYGATKLAMEKLFINANCYGGKFACVRFGNFTKSRGSFLTKLNDIPIPVTHEDMERYWIDIDEAANFTIYCLTEMKGGEVFVPRMDKLNIMDIIKDSISDAEIKITGRRAGEKLTEILFAEGENPEDRGDYYVITHS